MPTGPYVVAIVETAEGARMMTNIVGCEPEAVKVGMAVTIRWEPLSDGRHLARVRAGVRTRVTSWREHGVGRGAPAGLALRSPAGQVALGGDGGRQRDGEPGRDGRQRGAARIGDDLDAGVSALQWVLTGYLLALASLILLGGALGDRFGRRRVFVIGTAWFAAASLLCGAAPNVEVLVAARVLQGVGGALLTPGSLAILQASFRQSDRAAAVGAWSGLGGVAGAIGPFVGGGSSTGRAGGGRS